jgi:hypothetical protein
LAISGILAILLSGWLCATAWAGADVAAANSLKGVYSDLQPRLSDNAFGRPLHLDSRETQSALKGDIHAVVDHPFDQVRTALGNPDGWCDVLILQFNTKLCEPVTGELAKLVVYVGRKHEQPLEKAMKVEFPFRLMASTPEYFSVVLNAPTGPYGTRDYKIVLEAVPLEDGRTFLHLSYSYGFGMAARLATQTYLATTARNKAGFTVVGRSDSGEPLYVGGVRGMIERNTMRYFLAIESFLGSLDAPEGARVEKRLNDWISAVERYPRQLHEMEREEYLAMKRREIRRQEG